MKSKVGISFATGALAVGLAGTALAAESAVNQQLVQPSPGYGAQQVRPGPGYAGQQVQPSLGAGGQQVHPGLGAGGQQVHPGLGAGGQQVHPGLGAGGQQVHPGLGAGGPPPPPPGFGYGGPPLQMGPDYGAQEVLPDPDADEPDWSYDELEAVPTQPTGLLPAPSKAFEIGVSLGYAQGFGDLSCEQGLGQVAGAGAGLGLNLSYRVSPMLSVGVATQGQAFTPDKELGRGARVYGMTAGLDATVHLAPYNQVDPFISVGMGYRSLWSLREGPQNDVQTHGFQLARLNVGVDMRVSKDVAVGPMIGADLNTFAWKNPIGEASNERIRGMGVSTFLYAGVQGRFDVGGTRSTPME